jgi:hypothetical protein
MVQDVVAGKTLERASRKVLLALRPIWRHVDVH